MFPHIIRNPILLRTSQNIWKHHITRMVKTYTKLAALLSKLHGPNKGGLGPFFIWIKCTKTSSWCYKGFTSLALAETCTISSYNASFNAFILDLVMGSFNTCNGSLMFTGWSTSSPLSSKGFDIESKLVSNKVISATLKVTLTPYLLRRSTL